MAVIGIFVALGGGTVIVAMTPAEAADAPIVVEEIRITTTPRHRAGTAETTARLSQERLL